MSTSSPEFILEARDIVKRYPGSIALDHVTYKVYRNCVNVLIGENGAGKSTLMRVLAGVEKADEGSILLEGREIAMRSPREATAHGISIVHQELAVLPNLDISENIFAGREVTRGGPFVDRIAEDSRSTSALKRLRKPMIVQETVSKLSLGNRQIVELARTLAHGAKILILDEPTSALSSAETDSLFEVLAELKSSGVTIIYISHRLQELMHLGDQFTVLRSGRIVGEAHRSGVTRQWIVERMSGRTESRDMSHRTSMVNAPEVLVVQGLRLGASLDHEEAQAAVHDIGFTLHQGEVLGVYGLLGAGRTEMIEAVAGCRKILAGQMTINGVALRLKCVADAVRAGIVLVPEDRQRDGLVPELSIRENVALAAASGPFLSRTQETATVRELVLQLNIAARDLELPVTSLSGGNQQKVLLARCLMRSPKVLLLDEPTRGVDVGAKAEIYRILRGLAANGMSVLFTSSEVEETRELADRVLVMCEGKIVAEFNHGEVTDEVLFAAASPRMACLEESRISTGVTG